MRFSLLAFSALALATPALAQTAVEAEAGPTSALQLLERMVERRPNDANARRLLGSAYASEQRYDDARRVLAEAQALAPSDNDIRLARARVELWSGNRPQARAIIRQIQASEPGNAELPALIAAVNARDETIRPPALSISHTISPVRFNAGGKRTWNETVVSGDIALARDTRLTADIAHEDRDIAIDTRLGLRLDQRMTYGNAYIAAAVTPNADFREQWSLSAGAEGRVTKQINVTIDARHADYGTTTSNTLTPGIRLSTANLKTSLWLRSINLWTDGEHKNGWSGRIDHVPNDELQLFAGAATYPDTEAGVTRRVKSVYAGGAVALSKNMTLRLTADRETRAQSYRRTGFTVGLGWRFGP